MSTPRPPLSLAVLLLLCPALGTAADYPCWRGNGDGVWAESGQALVTDLDQKKLVWESEEQDLVPSYDFFEGGVGGLVYAEGRIYMTCAVPAGASDPAFREQFAAYVKQTSGKPAKVWPEVIKRFGGNEADLINRFSAAMVADVVLCIDAATGKTVWKQVFPDVAKNPNGRSMVGAPMLTFGKPKSGPHNLPGVGGDHVAVIGFGGDLYCLDAKTGALAWKKKVLNRSSTAASVLPAAGNFICLHDSSTDPKKSDVTFTAFKAADGSMAWGFRPPADINAQIGKPGPVRHVNADGDFVLFGGRAVDAASGALLWEVPSSCEGSVAIGDGYLVLPGDGDQQGPIAYRLSKPFTAAPTLAWKLEAANAAVFHCTPAIYRGHVWYKGAAPGDGLSRMVAVELASGTVATSEPFRNDACASCHAADGVIFYEVNGFPADPANIAKLPGFLAANGGGDGAADFANCHAPCYANGRIFIRGRNSVRCFDLRAKP